MSQTNPLAAFQAVYQASMVNGSLIQNPKTVALSIPGVKCTSVYTCAQALAPLTTNPIAGSALKSFYMLLALSYDLKNNPSGFIDDFLYTGPNASGYNFQFFLDKVINTASTDPKIITYQTTLITQINAILLQCNKNTCTPPTISALNSIALTLNSLITYLLTPPSSKAKRRAK